MKIVLLVYLTQIGFPSISVALTVVLTVVLTAVLTVVLTEC